MEIQISYKYNLFCSRMAISYKTFPDQVDAKTKYYPTNNIQCLFFVLPRKLWLRNNMGKTYNFKIAIND